MNRGFVQYFSKGMRAAAGLLLKGGKYVRYYVYWFVSMIGRCIPIFGLIFSVADVRRARIAEEESELTVLRAYGGVETGHSFGTTVFVFLIAFLVLAGGLAAIVAVGAGLAYLGLFIGNCVDINNPAVLPVVFSLPAVVAGIGYSVAVWLLFAPVPYILDTDKKASVTDVLCASVETMRRDGKGTYFLNTVVPELIKSAYVALAFGILMLLSDISSAPAATACCSVWLIVATVAYIVFAPVFTLATHIANVNLFRDIALEPDVMNNRTKGLFIKRCSVQNPLAAKGRDANLESLFEQTETTHTDPPDTRYVPPTDWTEKMRVYDPAEDGAQGQASADEPPAQSGGEAAQQTNDAGEQE